ncbi:hypothetical protein SAMN05443428_10762 [Caloramator quimbayensis]|uniref:YesK-like protein n=1 Tax=Caloramator quimbayensis TaxID=1147123 RepID=A0A1T4X9I2_9CLOT|nr:hypothetical protein [Caloramator quimbayensis]SKA86262.1 hypothetical protein SAMN05443428_10762 [Caloramator quimbayensis]
MKNFVFIILGVIIISIALALLLNKLFKGNKYIKYILPVLFFIFSVYSFYVSRTAKEGFLDIAYMLLFIICFAGFLSSFITSLILDYRKK